MHPCDLPADIVRLVLKEALSFNGHDAQKRYKNSLPLLAVCRKWRHAGLSIVQNSVFVQCNASKFDSRYTHGASGRPRAIDIATNMDLVVSAGCAASVKIMDIAVGHLDDLFTGLDAAAQAIQAVAEKWLSVRVLRVSVYDWSDIPDQGGAGVAEHEDDISRACSALVATLPNIHKVVFAGAGKSPVAQGLYGRLTGHYADQLRAVRNLDLRGLPPGCTFGHLRHACIRYDTTGSHQLHRMSPENLVSLGIFNESSADMWAPFSTGGPRTIVFPCLEFLCVSYTDQDAEDYHAAQRPDSEPWRLRFPKLKVLDIWCTQDVCSLLEYAAFPPRLDKIIVSTSTSVLREISHMSLPATDHIEIAIDIKLDDYFDVLAASTCIFDNAQGARDLVLDVRGGGLLTMSESIACTGLTQLEVAVATNVDTMLGLVQRLPRLIYLKLTKLEVDDIQADISVPEPGPENMLTPLNSKLRVLSIDHGYRQAMGSVHTDVVKYMLLRVPTLAHIYACNVPERPIARFILAYREWYPHLANVGYDLDSSDDSLEATGINIANLQSLLLGRG